MIDNEVDAAPPPAAPARRAAIRLEMQRLRPHLHAPASPLRHFPGPSPVPYHRISFPMRWWRTIAATAAIVAGAYFAVPLLLNLLVRALPDRQLPILGGGTAMAVSLFKIAMFIPAVLLAARFIERRRPGNVSSVAGRLRWPWLGLCLAAALASQVVLFVELFVLVLVFSPEMPAAADAALPARQEPWEYVLAGGLIILVLGVFQSAAEEYLTRGWLLQAIRFASPWPGIIVQAVIWTALHGTGPGPGSVGLLVYGLIIGWLTVHTGGLEAGIAKHVVHNGTLFTLQILISGLTPLDPSQSAADAVGWIGTAAWITSTAFYVGVVVILTKALHQWRDHSGPPTWAPPGFAITTGETNADAAPVPQEPASFVHQPAI